MRPHVAAEANAGFAKPATLGAGEIGSCWLRHRVAPLSSLVQPPYSVFIEERQAGLGVCAPLLQIHCLGLQQLRLHVAGLESSFSVIVLSFELAPGSSSAFC